MFNNDVTKQFNIDNVKQAITKLKKYKAHSCNGFNDKIFNCNKSKFNKIAADNIPSRA